MITTLIIGGVLFWLAVACFVSIVALCLVVGVIRAVSLHRFLFCVRRAADGGLRPFRSWRDWSREFAIDAVSLAGLPRRPHGRSYHFSAERGPIEAHWHGVGDWKLKRETEGTPPSESQ